MQNNQEIIVKDGTFYRRTYREENLGALTDIVEKAKSAKLTVIPDAFLMKMPSKEDYENGTYEEEITIPVHMGLAGSTLYTVHRLVYYPILGAFYGVPTVDKDYEKVPIRYNGSGSNKIKIACDYPGMWMIYAFRIENHRIRAFLQGYMSTNIRGKHFAPLLPNIFNNGKICFGQITVRYSGSIQSTVQSIFNSFYMSESNDHLLTQEILDTLHFKYTRKDGKFYSVWEPQGDFMSNPHRAHNQRDTTIAAELLEQLTIIEETDASLKVMKNG